MKILVEIQTLEKFLEIKIDYDNNKMFLNKHECKQDAKTLASRLIAITHSWPETLDNPQVYDGERYSIKIKNNHDLIEKTGSNKFPDNYELFKSLISEVEYGIYSENA